MAELEDFARLNRGAAARDALNLIGQTLEQEQERISKVAFAHIAKGSLTPELAMALFYQKYAVQTLQVRLTQEERQGSSAATRLSAETT